MGLIDDLSLIGVDTKSAIDRLAGDSDLYEELVKEFYEDIRTYDIGATIASADYVTANERSHALKGASANLGMDKLCKVYTLVNNFFKQGNITDAISKYQIGSKLEKQMSECIAKYL